MSEFDNKEERFTSGADGDGMNQGAAGGPSNPGGNSGPIPPPPPRNTTSGWTGPSNGSQGPEASGYYHYTKQDFQGGAYQPNPGGNRMPDQVQNPNQYQWKNNSSQFNSNEPYKWNFEDYESAGKRGKKKKNKGLMVFTVAICSVLAVGLIVFAGIGAWSVMNPQGFVDSPTTESSSSEAMPPQETTSGGMAIAGKPDIQTSSQPSAEGVLSTVDIAKKVKPSVVGIVQYSSMQSFLDPERGSSQGSGIIMSEDGYIITNAHVVAESPTTAGNMPAAGLKVVLEDGTQYEARLIGADPKTDLAVIKIEATGLPAAEFGDSEQLEVGERVVAIGNPSGLVLQGSVTQGIVSAVNRPIQVGDNTLMDCIQTDAAINPGNSGGALVNEFGQVVGINSSKIAATEYEGIGFAIPIHEAKPIIDDLKAYGMVKGRPKIGITMQQVDIYVARMYGVPQGLIIMGTEEGSDVAAKGIVPGDIITKVDDKDTLTFADINEILSGKKPGDTLKLTIFRRATNQADRTFEVTITLMEDSGSAAVQEAP